MLGINNYIIYGLIIGSVVTLMPYISGKQGHEPRLKILANLVMVKDTDHCNNKCFHIHHWMWLGLLFTYTLYLTGKSSWMTQLLFGVWISSTILEIVRYSDSLHIYQKCFPKCKVQKK